MTPSEYIKAVAQLYSDGKATEHSYRPALQSLLSSILPDTQVTNEPKRQKCGAPDYILTRRKIDIGYIEAKDIGVNLDKTEKDEQLGRYLESLDNLVLTDYLEFRFYQRGQKTATIAIAKNENGKIIALPDGFSQFETLVKDFGAFQGQTIKTAKTLAQMMARKAKLMRDVFFKAVSDLDEPNNSLRDQLKGFQNILMHDMDEAQFADVYAQTIAYGLFTARLHDTSLNDFTRQEARELIPKSNPFLRQLFDYIAGSELDSRVHWIVDALCEVYRYADLPEILKNFGKATGQSDPMLHFYETFLSEYDKGLRKDRGVWYTPDAVVNFIVRAVDDVLKTHFNLKDGLADTSKVEIEVETAAKIEKGKNKGETIKEKRTIHKVQILDVATGTGTFLAEIVKQIYKRYEGQEGLWSSYVEQDLLPRMHGFELLMASYAMCHMKLDMLLTETVYKPSNTNTPPRLGVYLTNSLEEHHPETDSLFAGFLSREANAANRIKKNTPIMVAIGNPPYSGISTNKGEWITNKIEDYKYIDGVHFNERKHWLGNDYVKFIRMGEHYIERNGEGILAYITDNSYLDNPTFRAMRWHLMQTFDDIHIYDLHGNANKNQATPNGKKDINVFDIKQGVTIIIAIKKQSNKKKMANVYYGDLWGNRESKLSTLSSSNYNEVSNNKLEPKEPFFFFLPPIENALHGDISEEYNSGFEVDKIFPVNTSGIVTMGDGFIVDFDADTLNARLDSFINSDISASAMKDKYDLGKNYAPWAIENKSKIKIDSNLLTQLCYRPFDTRYTYFDSRLVWRLREKIMRNLLKGKNMALIIPKQPIEEVGGFITRNIAAHKTFSAYNTNYIFPLYIDKDSDLGFPDKPANLDKDIISKIENTIGKIKPEQIFDYIYAVLYNRSYRTRYAEFLKSDFPRIPYPTDRKTFDALVTKGGELRALHLMESPVFDTLITRYPVSGDHVVDKPRFEKGKVWINVTQYFDGVSQIAWEFYIGGYQPAQKWLKDRKGRALTADDIRHYQRIIIALSETDRVMKEIDQISFLEIVK